MKKCPYCAEQIQDEALICRFCQRAVGDASTPVRLERDRPAPAKRKTSVFTWLIAGFFGLLFMGWCASVVSPTPPSTPASIATTPGAAAAAPAAAPAPAAPVLELLDARGFDEHGFHQVTGQVRNISGASLENVAVQVSWFTNDEQLVKTDEAMIDFNPILPGQTSPFKSMTSSNPAMARYSVQFKRLFGGTLETKDSRRK